MSYASAVREAIWSVDSRQPVLQMIPLEAVVNRSMAVQTMMSRIVGAMATVALLLAGLGVFGVVAFSVRSHTRELGVRLALGATAGRLQREVVGGSLKTIERWELFGDSADDHLKDRLPLGKVLETVLAEVEQRNTVGKRVLHQCGRRF